MTTYYKFMLGDTSYVMAEPVFLVTRMGLNGDHPGENLGVKPKAAYGSVCNNCGACCRSEPCPAAEEMEIPFISGYGCAAQHVTPEGVTCRLEDVENEWIAQHPGHQHVLAAMMGWGNGCDMFIAGYAPDQALSDDALDQHKVAQAEWNRGSITFLKSAYWLQDDAAVLGLITQRLTEYKTLWKDNYEQTALDAVPTTCGRLQCANSHCGTPACSDHDPRTSATRTGASDGVGRARTETQGRNDKGSPEDHPDRVVTYKRFNAILATECSMPGRNMVTVLDGLFSLLEKIKIESDKLQGPAYPVSVSLKLMPLVEGEIPLVLVGVFIKQIDGELSWTEGLLPLTQTEAVVNAETREMVTEVIDDLKKLATHKYGLSLFSGVPDAA